MRRVAAALVEDKDDVYIDDVFSTHNSYEETKIIKDENDPFRKPIDISKQSKRLKNKLYKMRSNLRKRQSEGEDGTKSKFLDPNMISGYGVFDVIEPPYNLEVLASLYEENAIHNACITARTMNTVGLGYHWENTSKADKKIERATGKAESANRTRDELRREEDKLFDLIDGLNKDISFTETLIRVWMDVLTTGNGYLEIGRNKNGKIGYIGHIPSIYVRVRRAKDGFIQSAGSKFVFFRNFQDLNTRDEINNDPNPNEIIHFLMYSPTNTYYGVPSAVSALSAIIGDKFVKEYNIDYFENKSIPRYAIILKGANLSQKSKQEVINYFKNEIKGNNHGTLFVPIPATLGRDVDLKFEALENTTQEASFDKYRKSNRDEITVAHRVPAPKIGIYDNANLAVSRDADKTFKTQVIGPDQQVIEKRVNKIIAEFSDLKKFKFAEIDIIDEDLRSRIWDRYLRTEVVTPNEVRAKIGMTAREGGDDILPYPTKIQQEKLEYEEEMDKKEQERKDEAAKNPPAPGTPSLPGAPVGNNNAIAGSPPKSQQDAANQPSTPVDQTTGRKERGQAQDGQ